MGATTVGDDEGPIAFCAFVSRTPCSQCFIFQIATRAQITFELDVGLTLGGFDLSCRFRCNFYLHKRLFARNALIRICVSSYRTLELKE
jgi:hypothetical protein